MKKSVRVILLIGTLAVLAMMAAITSGVGLNACFASLHLVGGSWILISVIWGAFSMVCVVDKSWFTLMEFYGVDYRITPEENNDQDPNAGGACVHG